MAIKHSPGTTRKTPPTVSSGPTNVRQCVGLPPSWVKVETTSNFTELVDHLFYYGILSAVCRLRCSSRREATMPDFSITSDIRPTGDQPAAIEQLVEGLVDGERMQTLLGVTGSGKTFTMANIVEQVNRPTLVLAHNKTLAAQLYSEFKEFFPKNAVEYFVSYYDYYQPEAYVPRTDTYIEKDSAHQRRDRQAPPRCDAVAPDPPRRADRRLGFLHLRSRFARGVPEHGRLACESALRSGATRSSRHLVDIQYDRNDMTLVRGTFRVARRYARNLSGLRGDCGSRRVLR